MPGVKVALVNAQDLNGRPTYGAMNYGLNVMSKALVESGFNEKDIGIFPLPMGKVGYQLTSNHVASFLGDAEIPVVAISTDSDSYPCYRRTLEHIKRKNNGALYVGGGTFFAKEDGEHPDSIDIELKGKRLNLACYGHGGPFVEFCKGLTDGSFRWDGKEIDGELPAGLYASHGDEIAGHGKGQLPETRMPMSITYYDGPRIAVYVNGNCPHGYGYCTCHGGSALVDPHIVTDIEELSEDGEITINLLDNNPFFNKHGGLDFVRAIRSMGIKNDVSIYLDDSLFVGDGWKKVKDFCDEYGINTYFVGRETPDAAVAEKMGRNYNGKPRSQSLLNNSFEGLMKFKAALKSGKQRMKVAYILSPFMDYGCFEKLISETSALTEGAEGVEVCVNNLVPYFGTDVRKRWRHMLFEPDNPFLLGSYTINWKPDENPGAFNAMVTKLRHSRYGEDVSQKELDRAFRSKPYYRKPVTVYWDKLVHRHALKIRMDNRITETPCR